MFHKMYFSAALVVMLALHPGAFEDDIHTRDICGTAEPLQCMKPELHGANTIL